MGATKLWVAAEFRRRWLSLALLAFLVALAGGVTIAAAAGARRADTAFARFVEFTGDGNVGAGWTFDGEIPADGFAADARRVFAEAQALDGVRSAVLISLWAATLDPGLPAFQFGLLEIVGSGSGTFVVDGALPDPTRSDVVVLNESAAEFLDVGAGDTIDVYTVAPSQADEWASSDATMSEFLGPTVPLEVAAITRGTEEIAQREDANITVMPGFYDRYHDEILNCVCFAGFDVDPERVKEVVAELDALYRPIGFSAQEIEGGQLPEQAGRAIDVEVRALQLVALAAAIAGLLVVAQAMLRQAADLAADQKVRRALGVTRRQMVGGSLLLLAPAVLAGAAGAFGLAVALSPLTPRGLARLAEVDPGIRVESSVVVLGVAALVALGLLLSAAAAWRATRSGSTRPSARPALATGLGPIPALGLSFTTQPGPRSRTAVATAVLAVATGLVAVVGVSTFEASRHHLLTTPRLFGLDADLSWNIGAEDALEQASLAAAADPGVTDVVLKYSVFADGGDPAVAVGPGGETAIEPSTSVSIKGDIAPTLLAGRLPEGPLEVSIGTSVADATGAEVGQTIEVRTGSRTSRLTVVGLALSAGTDEVSHAFEMTAPGFQALTGTTCSPSENISTCNPVLAVRVARGTAGREARQRLGSIGFGPVLVPSVVGNLSEVGPAPAALAVFLGLLAVGALAHALVLSVRHRRRDVAVARTIGFTPANTRAVLRWHALTMVGAGIVVGVPVGIVVGRLVWQAVAHSVGAPVDQALPWWVPVVVVAATLAVTLALVEPLARRAGRIRPADGLRTE